jgi:hypothetical protein
MSSCITPNVSKKRMSDRCSCRKLQQAADNHIYLRGPFLQLQEDVRELCLAAVQGYVSELSPRLYEAPAAAPTVYAELTPA